MQKLPECSVLWDYFEYNPLNGNLYWKINRGVYKGAGKLAGSRKASGHITVRINKIPYEMHRIIWKWMTGEDPGELQIDHKYDYVDGVHKSNYWWNLRKADEFTNNWNSGLRRDNSSGLKGVSYKSRTGKWVSQIQHCNQTIWIGTFPFAELAHAAYKKTAQELRGEFARC